MASWFEVRNRSHGEQPIVRARWCQSYLCRLRGLTFRRSLPDGMSLLLVNTKESRSEAAIHMWAVFFPLGVVWLDSSLRVVDCKIAQPWRVYLPVLPARYILEGPPSILDSITVGDVLEFIDEGAN